MRGRTQGDETKWVDALNRMASEDVRGEDVVQSGNLELFCQNVQLVLQRAPPEFQSAVQGILQDVVGALGNAPLEVQVFALLLKSQRPSFALCWCT